MMWRRRSSSISSDTVGQDRIEQLNSRFRLRILVPTSEKLKAVVQAILLQSDESTCSTWSSRSSQSCNKYTTSRRVRFSDEIGVDVPSMTFPSDSEAATIWYSQKEITDMKNTLRSVWKGSHINNPDFVEAVELVQNLFTGHDVPSDENLSVLDKSIVEPQRKLIEKYKRCARILASNEGRGLERMQYGKSSTAKPGAKSAHVERYIRSVLELEKLQINSTIDERCSAVAAQCNSESSTWWARISADVDEESLQTDERISIFHNQHKTESIEV